VFDVAFSGAASHINLLLVELHVAFLEFSHFLNLIQVDHEALLHVVQLSYALSAEDWWMLRTVEMLDALVMSLAEVGLDVVMGGEILCLKAFVEVDIG